MKNLGFITLISATLLSGCTSTRLTPLADQAAAGVFFSKVPDRPYRELAHVEHTGSIFSSRAQLLRRLQQRQAKAQGDALVQVRYDFVLWYPHASAVVVKYQ